MSRVDDVLRAARSLADPTSAIGRALRGSAVSEGALSPAMVDHVVGLTCARYTAAAVGALASDDRADRHVAVSLAATVPTAPLRAIALPWLAGASRVSVRAPRSQRAITDDIITAFGRGEIVRVDELPGDADEVIAYGGDETLATMARELPPHVAFEGYGHGFGLAYIQAPTATLAQAVARDVALYDQRGCLSPIGVFVRGDATDFARALHASLGALENDLPRGDIDAGEAAAVMQWRGVAAARCAWFRRGRSHSVGALARRALTTTPGMRNVVVCHVDSAEQLVALLGAQRRHVTCVGTDEIALASLLPDARVVAAGTMQDPALDGPEDIRARSRRAERGARRA